MKFISFAFAFLTVLLAMVTASMVPWPLFWDQSDSLPGKLILASKLKSKAGLCGKEVLIKLNQNSAYYQHVVLRKKLMGCPGDRITHQGQAVFINNVFAGLAKYKTSLGKPLNPTESQTIPVDYYYAWAPHSDSYDSRYRELGLIQSTQVIAYASTLF
jgi:conjugal transfer pilin signal peptidase TrbI